MQCVVPMATHLQTNYALIVIKGYVFRRITRGAHTSCGGRFGGAQHFFRFF